MTINITVKSEVCDSETWQSTLLYCPDCGKQDVFQPYDSMDIEVCRSCGLVFHYAVIAENAEGSLFGSVLKQLRRGEG